MDTQEIQHAFVTVLRAVPKAHGNGNEKMPRDKTIRQKAGVLCSVYIRVRSVTEKNYAILTILQRRAMSPPSCINVPTPSRILMCVKPIS